MTKEITSLTNPLIKYTVKLKNISFAKSEKKFLCEGKFNLEMALKQGVVETIFTTKELENVGDIEQIVVPTNVLEKISSLVNNEEVVFISKMEEVPFSKEDKLIYLDGVRDPGNMGTILRTALALGFDGVVLSSDCVSIYNAKVVSASKGAIFSLPIKQGSVQDYKRTHTIYVTTPLNEDTLVDTRVKEPYLLVFGSEAHGVSEEVVNLADRRISIKMNDIDSLNVAVCAGIVMFYFINGTKL
ncbi:MAG: RNA methyltransferase [Coprobacillus sp.]|nr:RNA methyltransferase [Coprobacillus sp.]